MSEFIRLPSVVLNVAHVVSVVRGPESVVVLLAVSEGITCGEQGKVAPIRLHFTGEEGTALLAYFEDEASDVMAWHEMKVTSDAVLATRATPDDIPF